MLHVRLWILRCKARITRISNYLEPDPRYMEAGEKAWQRQLGRKGRRVTVSHVIHHNFSHRYAIAALD